jgi:hypothetical protein
MIGVYETDNVPTVPSIPPTSPTIDIEMAKIYFSGGFGTSTE